MFQHILVPLDGSRRAESVLPLAANIARSNGASLLLLHVIPLSMGGTGYQLLPTDSLETVSDAYQAALAYLARVKRSEHLRALPVETYLVTGPVPQRILFSIETPGDRPGCSVQPRSNRPQTLGPGQRRPTYRAPLSRPRADSS